MKNDVSNELEEALSLISSPSSDEFVRELEKSVKEALDKTHGETEGVVESAIDLETPEKTKLTTHIEKVLGRKMEFRFVVVPKLLGGFAVRVGDWQLDASLLKQIDYMRKELAR